MGCFSYICLKCRTPIRSNAFKGEHCELFLLDKGKVIEQMSGEYDSYGRTFGHEWRVMRWGEIVDLHFGKRIHSGIAAYHSACWNGSLPTYKSRNDPNQGWGLIRDKYRRRDYGKTKTD